ncbi:hypothetical protein B0H17DRAFT_1125115 [Mycena rosella]|uniref:Uncharacterized protein n=1 Tax=Mycena rosella TaxID=1033263 RepID=A0AAD7GZ63_MYCRO|nr:hypothetical protein B0H17DRAFT_1125115 [Mycena rosella]
MQLGPLQCCEIAGNRVDPRHAPSKAKQRKDWAFFEPAFPASFCKQSKNKRRKSENPPLSSPHRKGQIKNSLRVAVPALIVPSPVTPYFCRSRRRGNGSALQGDAPGERSAAANGDAHQERRGAAAPSAEVSGVPRVRTEGQLAAERLSLACSWRTFGELDVNPAGSTDAVVSTPNSESAERRFDVIAIIAGERRDREVEAVEIRNARKRWGEMTVEVNRTLSDG